MGKIYTPNSLKSLERKKQSKNMSETIGGVAVMSTLLIVGYLVVKSALDYPYKTVAEEKVAIENTVSQDVMDALRNMKDENGNSYLSMIPESQIQGEASRADRENRLYVSGSTGVTNEGDTLDVTVKQSINGNKTVHIDPESKS